MEVENSTCDTKVQTRKSSKYKVHGFKCGNWINTESKKENKKLAENYFIPSSQEIYDQENQVSSCVFIEEALKQTTPVT